MKPRPTKQAIAKLKDDPSLAPEFDLISRGEEEANVSMGFSRPQYKVAKEVSPEQGPPSEGTRPPHWTTALPASWAHPVPQKWTTGKPPLNDARGIADPAEAQLIS